MESKIEELKKENRDLKFQLDCKNQVHEYDIDMIDKIKGEAVKLYKKIEVMAETLLEYETKLEEKDKIINKIKEYEQWHIDHTTESIIDYIDDDKIVNKDIIAELKEEREWHRDVLRIINNEEIYIKWEE